MSKKYIVRPPKQKQEPEVYSNYKIRAKFVRVIDENGALRGEMSISEAINLAQSLDIDLVQLNGDSVPTCKLCDLQKFLYERKKKQKERNKIARENAIETKQISIHITIDKNDLSRKLNEIKKFITEGNNVKFSLQLRGREQAIKNDAFSLMRECVSRMSSFAEPDSDLKLNGKNIEVLLKPIS